MFWLNASIGIALNEVQHIPDSGIVVPSTLTSKWNDSIWITLNEFR
jgi:hypothetical protein